jgi:stage V sporulation protein SpoVS
LAEARPMRSTKTIQPNDVTLPAQGICHRSEKWRSYHVTGGSVADIRPALHAPKGSRDHGSSAKSLGIRGHSTTCSLSFGSGRLSFEKGAGSIESGAVSFDKGEVSFEGQGVSFEPGEESFEAGGPSFAKGDVVSKKTHVLSGRIRDTLRSHGRLQFGILGVGATKQAAKAFAVRSCLPAAGRPTSTLPRSRHIGLPTENRTHFQLRQSSGWPLSEGWSFRINNNK